MRYQQEIRDETNQHSRDGRRGDHGYANKGSVRRWWLMVLLVICILFSQAPVLYGKFTLLKGNLLTNPLMIIVVSRSLSLIFMIVCVFGTRNTKINFSYSPLSWIGKNKGFTIVGAIALPIVLVVADILLLHIFCRLGISSSDGTIRSDISTGTTILIVQSFLIVIAVPFVEEIFWRGHVQNVLQKIFNRPVAIVAQAALFALFHLRGFAGGLQVFISGLILGIWYDWKRTLLPLIVAHMIFNSLHFVRLWSMHLELQKINATQDCRALIEDLCIPSDYSDEENARFYYERAYGLLVEMPGMLSPSDVTVWPTEVPDEKLTLLRQWIYNNRNALAEFEEGSKKPYHFRKYREQPFFDFFTPLNEKAPTIISLLVSRAQINAVDGDFESCFSDILTCYRYSQHLAAPKPFNEQLEGIASKYNITLAVFRILQRTKASSAFLEELQSGLEAIFQGEKIPIDFSTDRLIFRGLIKRIFTDDGTGNGRIHRAFFNSRREPNSYLLQLFELQHDRKQQRQWWDLERSQTVQATEHVFLYLSSIQNCTPSQLNHKGMDVWYSIKQLAQNNIFVLVMTEDFVANYSFAYHCKAYREALIVTVAIMRYWYANGKLPDGLEQLIQTNYIDLLPIDPYSDEPFIYKKRQKGFLLYSVGPDFNDDGGSRGDSNLNMKGEDDIFWPPAEEYEGATRDQPL